ncbi:hypothetical protein [Enterococcus mundtii]|nr:hypothetical protein [Enterococcus mundtii]
MIQFGSLMLALVGIMRQ